MLQARLQLQNAGKQLIDIFHLKVLKLKDLLVERIYLFFKVILRYLLSLRQDFP